MTFTCLQYKSFENTVGKKEKMFIMSSLFHRVFYPFGEFPAIFTKFKFVVFKLFHFGRVKILSSEKGLINYQDLNPKSQHKILDSSKTSADDKIKNDANESKFHNIIRNIVGKGENSGFQYFLLLHNICNSLF